MRNIFDSQDNNFNKAVCFSNIRRLVKRNAQVKLGEIEKEAGVSAGYMSRLEKEGNTSEPCVRFLVTAAKLLNVSLDSLLSVDLSKLTPTEEYLLVFFNKVKRDTVNDKLNWSAEDGCFKLQLVSNGTLCFKEVPSVSGDGYEREAWIYTSKEERQKLVASCDDTPLAAIFDELYSVVQRCFSGAKISKSARAVIDSFMSVNV